MKTCSLTALAALVLLASSPTVPAQDLPPDTVMTALAEGRFPKVPLSPPPTAPGTYAKPNFPRKSWEKYFVNLGGPEAVIKWGDRYHKDQGRGRERAAGNRRYIINWAPLGIRTLMHAEKWGGGPAVLAKTPAIPDPKYAKNRIRLCNAFEVVGVLKGSPAEGHLKAGDLLISMAGQRFKDADELGREHYGWPIYRRNLEMHAGELLDAAEGRGTVTFKVITISPAEEQKAEAISEQFKWTVAWERKKAEAKPADSNISFPVRGGDVVWPFFDAQAWESAVLVGGGKALPVTMAKEDANKGRFRIRRGHLVYVPPGQWTLRAKAATPLAQDITVYKLNMPQYFQAIEKMARTVTFPIDKIGTFSKTAPFNCAKTANIVAQQADWLAAQQQENGAWPRRKWGYTSDHWDTSWAGLALMATGDEKYDEQIKKAAHYVATCGQADNWTVPTATAITFLSEYWLRYRDDAVLPGIRYYYDHMLAQNVFPDFTAGHGYRPGYRGLGMSSGGSAMGLAVALAYQTPIGADRAFVDRVLARAQELGPGGRLPYGRGSWGPAEFKAEGGLAGGAAASGRHGPYLIASLIHGGPRIFTERSKTCRWPRDSATGCSRFSKRRAPRQPRPCSPRAPIPARAPIASK